MRKEGVKKCKDLQRKTFVDRRNSINLSLTRSKMAEPTYFLGNSQLFLVRFFPDYVIIYVPLMFFTNLHAVLFTAPLLFFSHIQIFRVWNSLRIYMENLFSQNISDEDSI